MSGTAGDLDRRVEQLFGGHRPGSRNLPKRFVIDQFHNDASGIRVDDLVYRDDVRMVERSGGPGLLLEAGRLGFAFQDGLQQVIDLLAALNFRLH